MEQNQKKLGLIRRWYRTAQPNKWIWSVQILSYIVYVIFLTIITIFAARTINSLYQGDWQAAFFYLALELLTIIIRAVAYHVKYIYYSKHHIHIRKNIAKKLYKKVLSCDYSNTGLTKEKMANICFNNSSDIATFADSIAKIIGIFIQSVITLTIIFVANLWAGLIVLAVGVMNAFAYYFYNKKLGKIRKERYENNDKIFQSFSKVIEGRPVINEYAKQKLYEQEVLQSVQDHAKSYKKYYMLHSWKTNIQFVVWNAIVYLITALLIYFVSQGTLDLETYLIIVPYLSSGSSKLTELFEQTKGIEEMRADIDRIDLILNMSDKELLQYGQINQSTPGYNLGLIEVSYQNNDPSSMFYGSISDIDISFMMNKINVIKGARGSGKRQIFNLLRRYIKPDKGVVLLDNLSLYDYSEATFKSHINYCSSHPSFIKGSIKENLLIANKDENKIEEVCKRVGVYKAIKALPNGFDTNISDVSLSSTRFLIGLARAVLSDCKILMIYEIPEDTPARFRNNVKQLLESYSIDKTIIVFTHSDIYNEITDMMFEIEKGKIKKITLGPIQAKPRKRAAKKASDKNLNKKAKKSGN